MTDDSTQRFTDRVTDYVKYRPGYPSEVVTFLHTTCGLAEGARVADIGAGTGISSKLLLDAGHPVTLSGHKVVRNDTSADVWSDTTTLYTRVLQGHVSEADEFAAHVVASGIIRISPPDFLKQLTTFRAEGPSFVSSVAALSRFGALFVGQLWQVYAKWAMRRARGYRGGSARADRARMHAGMRDAGPRPRSPRSSIPRSAPGWRWPGRSACWPA